MDSHKTGIDGPQAHVTYFEPGHAFDPTLGIIKLEHDRVTFTTLKGEAVVSIPFERIKVFGVTNLGKGGTTRGWRKYQFKITTKDNPAKKYRFQTWTNHTAYGLSKDEFQAENKRPVSAWIVPLRAQGVKVNNSNTVFYTMLALLAVFMVCMVAVFFLAQQTSY